jgi:hypothetical protein
MTIDELAELTREGFAGVHSRLDALNGRTRANEVGLAELRVQTRQLDVFNEDKEGRLRTIEHQAVAHTATSRRAGIKWGAIVSGVLTILTYIASWLAGVHVK